MINRLPLVSETTRAAVERTLEMLEYIPNHAARSLHSSTSKAVGLVVPTMRNAVFVPTIEAIERTLGESGYALLISCSNRDSERELTQVRGLIERGVDGMILSGSARHSKVIPLLGRLGIPFVCHDHVGPLPDYAAVALDNAGAMHLAIDHLVKLGHRRIALLTGPPHETPPVAERLDSAKARLASHGIVVAKNRIEILKSFDAAVARQGARRLIGLAPRPTAIACTGDVPALAAIAECRAAGLTIPDDISIFGCGDLALAQFAEPALTTIRLRYGEMGARAAEILLSLIAGEDKRDGIILPVELVAGETVGRPTRKRA